MRITEIREKTVPIASPIANAFIDFSKMNCSVVAVTTDVIRDGKPVVGYGFNSNGRYGQGALIRERFAPRVLAAEPGTLVDEQTENLDPAKIWNRMMTNEKPGGHGERSVAVGTIDMAVWDAVAKIAEKTLFELLAERYGNACPEGITGLSPTTQSLRRGQVFSVTRRVARARQSVATAAWGFNPRNRPKPRRVLKGAEDILIEARGRRRSV